MPTRPFEKANVYTDDNPNVNPASATHTSTGADSTGKPVNTTTGANTGGTDSANNTQETAEDKPRAKVKEIPGEVGRSDQYLGDTGYKDPNEKKKKKGRNNKQTGGEPREETGGANTTDENKGRNEQNDTNKGPEEDPKKYGPEQAIVNRTRKDITEGATGDIDPDIAEKWNRQRASDSRISVGSGLLGGATAGLDIGLKRFDMLMKIGDAFLANPLSSPTAGARALVDSVMRIGAMSQEAMDAVGQAWGIKDGVKDPKSLAGTFKGAQYYKAKMELDQTRAEFGRELGNVCEQVFKNKYGADFDENKFGEYISKAVDEGDVDTLNRITAHFNAVLDSDRAKAAYDDIKREQEDIKMKKPLAERHKASEANRLFIMMNNEMRDYVYKAQGQIKAQGRADAAAARHAYTELLRNKTNELMKRGLLNDETMKRYAQSADDTERIIGRAWQILGHVPTFTDQQAAANDETHNTDAGDMTMTPEEARKILHNIAPGTADKSEQFLIDMANDVLSKNKGAGGSGQPQQPSQNIEQMMSEGDVVGAIAADTTSSAQYSVDPSTGYFKNNRYNARVVKEADQICAQRKKEILDDLTEWRLKIEEDVRSKADPRSLKSLNEVSQKLYGVPYNGIRTLSDDVVGRYALLHDPVYQRAHQQSLGAQTAFIRIYTLNQMVKQKNDIIERLIFKNKEDSDGTYDELLEGAYEDYEGRIEELNAISGEIFGTIGGVNGNDTKIPPDVKAYNMAYYNFRGVLTEWEDSKYGFGLDLGITALNKDMFKELLEKDDSSDE